VSGTDTHRVRGLGPLVHGGGLDKQEPGACTLPSKPKLTAVTVFADARVTMQVGLPPKPPMPPSQPRPLLVKDSSPPASSPGSPSRLPAPTVVPSSPLVRMLRSLCSTLCLPSASLCGPLVWCMTPVSLCSRWCGA